MLRFPVKDILRPRQGDLLFHYWSETLNPEGKLEPFRNVNLRTPKHKPLNPTPYTRTPNPDLSSFSASP